MLMVWKNLVTNRPNQIIHFAHVTPVMAASQMYIRCVAVSQFSSLIYLFLVKCGFMWEVNAPVDFGDG